MKYVAKRPGEQVPPPIINRIFDGPHNTHSADTPGTFDDTCITCGPIIASDAIELRPI